MRTTETWEIKPGMNVICLCKYRMAEEWADEYFRVQIEVHRETDTLSLQSTSELHRRWQMFRLADYYPLPLAETVAITLGVKMFRQGDAVAQTGRDVFFSKTPKRCYTTTSFFTTHTHTH